MTMEKKGSAPIISKVKLADNDDKKGIKQCPKCKAVYLSARGSCPNCSQK